MGLKEYIIEKSKELNIDIIGFTDCKPLFNIEKYLIERKKEGKQTEFEERDIVQRIDPRSIFSDCKSIIVIGISYNNNFNGRVDYKLKGILSKSTWGIDYHTVLSAKMEKLIEEIRKIKNFKSKAVVDTGPLVERELAKKAGIGYYGKNCSIINDIYGSFIFIGYVLTDLDIKTDYTQLQERCGDCRLCIEACPTGALENSYKFNPKKCISYLTQTRNKIPYELRNKMGNKIYGCDTCQLICPKNKGINLGSHEEFIPKETRGYMDIEEILSISNREFINRYGSMAGSWRGKNILKRNGIIALGNKRYRDGLKLLKPLLKDSSPMIREYAAWAILNIDYEYGKDVIESILDWETHGDVKFEFQELVRYFKARIHQ